MDSYMSQGETGHQAVFCDNTAPNPNLLTSVSKRNGLLKSAKANTGASRHAFLSISKAACTSLVSITHLFFLPAPSPDRCSYSGFATHANPLMELLVITYQAQKGLGFGVCLRWGKFSHSFPVLLAGLNALLGYMMG